jgi:hypothetical protein
MTRVDADVNAQWTRAARRVDPVTAETLGTASDLHRSTTFYSLCRSLSLRCLSAASIKLYLSHPGT